MPSTSEFLSSGIIPHGRDTEDLYTSSASELDADGNPTGVDELREFGRMFSDCICYREGKSYSIIGYVRLRETGDDCFIAQRGSTNYLILKSACQYDIPQLGYVNLNGIAVRISLDTRRHWRLGLTPATLNATIPFSPYLKKLGVHAGELVTKRRSSGISMVRDVLKAIDVHNVQYPSYHNCVASVSKGESLSQAFDRRFAVAMHPFDGSLFLMLNNRIVGSIDKSGNLTINDAYEWLSDTLRELTK